MDTGKTHRQLLFEETHLDESHGSRVSLSSVESSKQMNKFSPRSADANKRRIHSDSAAIDGVEDSEHLLRATSLLPLDVDR